MLNWEKDTQWLWTAACDDFHAGNRFKVRQFKMPLVDGSQVDFYDYCKLNHPEPFQLLKQSRGFDQDPPNVHDLLLEEETDLLEAQVAQLQKHWTMWKALLLSKGRKRKFSTMLETEAGLGELEVIKRIRVCKYKYI